MGKLTISMAVFNSYVKLPEAIGSGNDVYRKRTGKIQHFEGDNSRHFNGHFQYFQLPEAIGSDGSWNKIPLVRRCLKNHGQEFRKKEQKFQNSKDL